MKSLIGFSLIGATLLSVTAAAAEPQIRYFERTATVYAADLDLARQHDAHVLYERIDQAAQAICTADELSFDTKKRRHWRECVEAAIARAIGRANAPLLMAIHLQRREQLARL